MPVVLQIDAPLIPSVLINKAPGVWEYPLSGALEWIWGNTRFKTAGVPMITPEALTSVRVSRDELTPVQAFESVCWKGVPGSYFYNIEKFAIDFNISEYGKNVRRGWRPPWGKHIEISIVVGASDGEDESREDGIYYRGVKYPPLLGSLPEITRQRDNTTYGVIAYNEATIPQTNIPGSYNKKSYKGCLSRLIDVPDGMEIEDGGILISGIVTNEEKSNTDYEITIGDKRYQLDNSFTTGALAKSQFPYLESEYEGKHYPFAWNNIVGYKTFKLNGENKSTNTIECCFCAAFDGDHKPKRVNKIYMKDSDSGDRECTIDIKDLCSIYLFRTGDYDGAAYFTVNANAGTLFHSYDNQIINQSTDTIISIGTKTGENTPSLLSSDEHNKILPDDTVVYFEADAVGYTAKAGDVIFALYNGVVHRWVVASDSVSVKGDVYDLDDTIYIPITLSEPVGKKMTIDKINISIISRESEYYIDYFAWHNTKAGESEYRNVADIGMDMLTVFGGYQDNDFYINKNSWNIERFNAISGNRKISYLIDFDSSMKINEALSDVFTSADGCFNTESDSRFSIRMLDYTKSASFELKESMFVEDPKEADDLSTVYSSVIVKYGPAGSGDNEREYLYDDEEQEIIDTYKISRREKFETCLETLTDAKKFAKTKMDKSKTPETKTTFSIVYKRDIATKNPGDYFISPYNGDGDRAYFELLEININKAESTITLLGIKRADIIYESGYTQGSIMGDGIMGDTVMAVTTEAE